MAVNDVQIPPIRTGLADPDVAGQTAKEWYLYWRQSGDRINVFNGMISYGGHGNRPLPGDAPDGALYDPPHVPRVTIPWIDLDGLDFVEFVVGWDVGRSKPRRIRAWGMPKGATRLVSATRGPMTTLTVGMPGALNWRCR